MEEDLIRLLEIINRDYDDVEEIIRVRIPRRYIRNGYNPLEFFGNVEFKRRFRFSKETVVEVLFPLVENFFDKPTRRGLPVEPMIALLAVLRFYATSSFQVKNNSLF